MTFKERLLSLSGRQKRILQVIVDVVLIWFALWFAFGIRLGAGGFVSPLGEYFWLFMAAPFTALPFFIRMGLYRAVMRYVGIEALIAVGKSVTLSALLLTLVIFLVRPDALMPRSVVFIYWWLALCLIGGVRLMMRQYFTGGWLSGGHILPVRMEVEVRRVVIYGAGSAGNQLLAALRQGRLFQPVAFLDDDTAISNRVIAGLRVYKPKHIEQMIRETGAKEVLLAIPSASRARRREILESLEGYPLHVRSVPDVSDLAQGLVKVDDLQEVDIGDLLGRDQVAPREELLSHCIRGRAVMVTGAGGSIGSELCRQILECEPSCLVLYEHSEFNLYSIHSELQQLRHRLRKIPPLVPILGSVRDRDRLLDVMSNWGIGTVYHAAAYKHVPIVEHNVAEGILNNVLGTLYSAQAAICAGVTNFVLISTDKAVRPTNVMGGSKRLSEMVLQALSQEAAPVLYGEDESIRRVNKTHFTMVRFGNVLGSSGSVIPLFREQIKKGGPVTVTHPSITRYFMTIPEAAQLVIQAGSMGHGGDVFVLDMGSPVNIAELAEKMIHLSGLTVCSAENPRGDIAIQFTGLRPGEKLYEELLIGENVKPTDHPMILRASEEYLPWDAFRLVLTDLLKALESYDYVRVRQLLRETVNGYTPEEEIVDWIHQQRRIEPSSSRH